MVRRLMKRFGVAVSVAAVVLSLSASAVFAGEITGNGRLKTVHGNSPCAFSGQEDLQWYTTDGDTTPVADPIKGDPAHSQNWGHVKQDTGLTGGANSVPLAEWGCNAHEFGLKN
jgi:hypothetical protein